MRIALDIDEVLMQFVPFFLRWHNQNYQTNLTLSDIKDYNLNIALKCTPEEAVQRIFEFYKSPEFNYLEPLEGAQAILSKLAKNHDLIAITSRPQFLEQATRDSLDQYFQNSISELYMTGEWFQYSQKTKADLCEELSADVIVDDRPKYCLECMLVGTTPILFNLNNSYGWQNNNPKIRFKATSWQEVSEYINLISNKKSQEYLKHRIFIP